MNKKELIEKIDNLQYSLSWNIPRINKEIVIDLIEQLDEPQKPVVPQFVADWYEEHKEELEFNIWDWIKYTQEEEKIKNRQFTEWLAECENDPVETLIKMKLFGYEAEKEKRYLVKMKGVDSRTNYLYYGVWSKTWLFKAKLIDGNFRKSHTRKELEQDNFGWVFDCEGVEIDEVEG